MEQIGMVYVVGVSLISREENLMATADQIKEHMEVSGKDGQHVGTVDGIEGDRIKLTKSDASDDHHHFLSMDLVDRVEDNRVFLNVDADQAKKREA